MSSPFVIIQKAFIINPKWQVLIIKRGESENFWDFPGGTLEYAQSLKDGLITKVEAETSLKLTTVSIPLHLTTFLDPGDRTRQIVRIVYLCIGVGIAKSPHAQDALHWINASDFRQYPFPDEAYNQTFENYLSHSKLASIEFLGPGILTDTVSYLRQSSL